LPEGRATFSGFRLVDGYVANSANSKVLMRLLLYSIPCLLAFAGHALELPAIFSHHMVLQQDTAVPVWGQAEPGATVKLTFGDQTHDAVANDAGAWRVTLAPMISATAGRELAITAEWPAADENSDPGFAAVVFGDVVVGEVWLGSGQSNMAGTMARYAPFDRELLDAQLKGPYPEIRLCGKSWSLADMDSIDGFSALLFAFGMDLYAHRGGPIGLIMRAEPGSPAGRWLTQAALDADSDAQAMLEAFAETYDFDELELGYEVELAGWIAGTESEQSPKPPLDTGECEGGIGSLYSSEIAPIAPYAIRGVLWDQGESGPGIVGLDMATAMSTLINSWRAAWDEDLPFIYMQKPNGDGAIWGEDSLPAARLPLYPPLPHEGAEREQYSLMLRIPHTAMAISSDLDNGLHPRRKLPYARRFAAAARSLVYEEKLATQGPTYSSHKREKDGIVVRFNHVGDGLVARGAETIQGFMLAGKDEEWHWAEGRIEGEDTVLLTCEAIRKPVAIRYAWAAECPWANLFNSDQLPALTFRTDDWPLEPEVVEEEVVDEPDLPAADF
jgi:sialate O-acetylesterase